MLSDRITELFRLLQCSNTEIAHFAGCSPSNISRLKRGLTRPKKGSRAAMHLAEGIYRYADYENMLEMLAALCHTPETGAAAMVPAIAAWLYEETDYEPPRAVTPKSRLRLARQRQSFGERLDEAMTLLEMTNTQLAGMMNIDPSLVSRYRSGVLYPNRNEQIKEQLCDHLMSRAERVGKKKELAALCGSGYATSKPGARGGEHAEVREGGSGYAEPGAGARGGEAAVVRGDEPEEFSSEVLADWLFDEPEDRLSEMAENLFRSIDNFSPGGVPAASQIQLTREADHLLLNRSAAASCPQVQLTREADHLLLNRSAMASCPQVQPGREAGRQRGAGESVCDATGAKVAPGVENMVCESFSQQTAPGAEGSSGYATVTQTALVAGASAGDASGQQIAPGAEGSASYATVTQTALVAGGSASDASGQQIALGPEGSSGDASGQQIVPGAGGSASDALGRQTALVAGGSSGDASGQQIALEPAKYWGTAGLRSAVERFLRDAAREGGELLLYSDEPMDWMTGDRDYFALWASLMADCVRRGVSVRIIHNVDRVGPEMVDAIHGWLPLYMSGRIEPYIFRKPKNVRFYHTLFLRPGGAAIQSFFPVEAGEDRVYDFISDRDHLGVLERGYEAMLAHAAPFLKTYPIARGDSFWQFCREMRPDRWCSILNGLSVPTMPENLIERMVERAGVAGARREMILERCRRRRLELREMLDCGSVNEILCLPDPSLVKCGGVRLNLGAEMMDEFISYTPEEYAGHLAAIRDLVVGERNYHLTILPQAPFRDLQVFTLRDAIAVLRCQEPCAAFVSRNEMLTRSVVDYCGSLIRNFAADRSETVLQLEELMQ